MDFSPKPIGIESPSRVTDCFVSTCSYGGSSSPSTWTSATPSPMAHLAGRGRPQRTNAGRHARSLSLLYPLDVVYARSGVPRPVAKALAPADLPVSYRSLLDHERDMTGTLEKHCGDRVALRVLTTFAKGRSYFR